MGAGNDDVIPAGASPRVFAVIDGGPGMDRVEGKTPLSSSPVDAARGPP